MYLINNIVGFIKKQINYLVLLQHKLNPQLHHCTKTTHQSHHLTTHCSLLTTHQLTKFTVPFPNSKHF